MGLLAPLRACSAPRLQPPYPTIMLVHTIDHQLRQRLTCWGQLTAQLCPGHILGLHISSHLLHSHAGPSDHLATGRVNGPSPDMGGGAGGGGKITNLVLSLHIIR